MNLPPEQVVLICRVVCHQWKDIADCQSLWKNRCRREGYRLHDNSKVPKDWRLFFFMCKKRRNLLKNPQAEDEMRDWQILENNGHHWKIEPIIFAHPNESVQKNFVTSFGMCTKCQLIDLEKEGYNASFMDHLQPQIKISDWYAPRTDCGCQYMIHVELLNQKKKPIKTFSPEKIFFEQWNDGTWNQITHVFQNYGPGVRFIRFVHGGQDSQFWAGCESSRHGILVNWAQIQRVGHLSPSIVANELRVQVSQNISHSNFAPWR
ncbi:F-box only protein 6-like isoform X2 [Stigmatopora nigra]